MSSGLVHSCRAGRGGWAAWRRWDGGLGGVGGDDGPRLGEVAGGRMPLATVDERGRLDGADVLCLPAARTEPAARGRVGRARDVALEQDPVLLAAQRRLVQGH